MSKGMGQGTGEKVRQRDGEIETRRNGEAEKRRIYALRFTHHDSRITEVFLPCAEFVGL
jgi:hypothetical protein